MDCLFSPVSLALSSKEDLKMDVDFQTEKRKSSLGKRYRDQVDDKDDDRKAESDMETDNFQMEKMDFSLGKLYRKECFRILLEVPEKQRPTYGHVFVEVFRVTVNVPEGRKGYLSGKIYFTDFNEYVYIYKQGGEGGQPIKEGCDLLTTASGLPCYDSLSVFVDLLFSTAKHQPLTDCCIPDRDKRLTMKGHYDDEGDFYDDKGNLIDFFDVHYYDMDNNDTEDELDDIEDNFIRISNCKGSFRKNGRFKESKFKGLYFYRTHSELFDKALSYTVCSKDDTCSVTMFYTIFSKAVQATVEMVWLKHEPEIGIYGLIAARYDMIEEKDFEIILFLKDLCQSVPVVSGQPIQLSRSVIAVPIDSNLLVRVHLSTKDKPFHSARLLFPAQQSGISELTIDCTMQVKVTWQHFM